MAQFLKKIKLTDFLLGQCGFLGTNLVGFVVDLKLDLLKLRPRHRGRGYVCPSIVVRCHFSCCPGWSRIVRQVSFSLSRLKQDSETGQFLVVPVGAG